jgi:hypothetical protein
MKKHVQKFESFQIKKRLDDAIQESVMQVNDIYKVKAIVDIPKSLINQVIKKVKDESGKDLRNFYGDQDIAEELIKYINQTFVNADSIPTAALVGGEAPKVQAQAQVAPAQAQVAPAQAQVAPVEGQAEAQPAAQVQVEAQPAAQTQAQPEAQATGEFENVEEGEEEAGETEEEETEEEKAQREAEEGEEENLPL